jgi:hypothetical protein
MRSTALWLGSLGVAVVMVATAGFLAVVVWADNRALHRQIGDVQEERRVALGDLRESDQQRQKAEQSLILEREKTTRFQSELSALRAQPPAVVPPVEERRAVRARVYAGRQVLGDAWVIQGGTATNQTGAKAEPAVLLDESVLRGFMAVLARVQPAPAVPTEMTVNYNYPTHTPYSGWWPSWYVLPSTCSTNGPPAGGVPQDPPSTKPPPDGAPSGLLRPTQKPFLPNPSTWPIVTPPRTRQPVVSPLVNPPMSRPAPSQALARSPMVQPTAPVNRPNPGGSGRTLPGR